MKNLKIYLSILFISLITSSIFFACSSDENQTNTASSVKKETVIKASTNKPADTRLSLTLDPPPLPPSCCSPTLSAQFICRGSGRGLSGSIDIQTPTGCSVDWSTISKIEIGLSDPNTRFTTTGPLNGLSEGTLNNNEFTFINNKIHLVFMNTTTCLSELQCYATFYYNNGCTTTRSEVFTSGPISFPAE